VLQNWHNMKTSADSVHKVVYRFDMSSGRDATIGLCTDSHSRLPAVLAERYHVEVVPMTIVVNGHEYLEGLDIDADTFYDLCEEGHRPTVAVSEPSPGQFAAAYDDLVDRGCTQILSIHTSAAMNGNLNVARLAARTVPVPVRLVDSRASGFGVSCCLWAAGEAILRGASFDEAALVAESLGPSIASMYVVGIESLSGSDGNGVAVLTCNGADEAPSLATMSSVPAAVNAMSRFATGRGVRINVAVGSAHRSAHHMADALARSIANAGSVAEVVRFRIGPGEDTVTGMAPTACAVGCVVYPVDAGGEAKVAASADVASAALSSGWPAPTSPGAS
jgi:fatty acid-binding protein DegV